MKLNWGHGITIAIGICMLAILSLVFFTTREKIDLVTEEYYPKELAYEKQIEKLRNSEALTNKAIILVSDYVIITFPKTCLHADSITGEIMFYRPSDKHLDKREKIKLDGSYTMRFLKSKFMNGKYEIILEWNDGTKAYLQKETLIVN